MNIFLNRVLLGSSLAAGLIANGAIAATSDLDLGPSISATEAPDLVENIDLSSASEIVEASAEQLIADGSVSSFGEESYHLDSLIASPDDDAEGQVTSVSQLSDVQPTDWAFQAVQSLVERYGCVAGYPDGTYRGQRAMTRYEAAALVNSCLDNISDQFATKEDLETIRALQEEFQAELATLRGRVDGLEARTDTLEAQQFSTTTKLNGEVIMALSGFINDADPDDLAAGDDPDPDTRPRFTGRARLNFLTSFSGKDLLYTRLQASNNPINFNASGTGAPFTAATGTAMTRLAFDTVAAADGTFALDRLTYKFPVGDRATVTVQANNGFHHYTAPSINPFYEGGGGGKGAISWFGERTPIFRNGTVGNNANGIGIRYDLADRIRFDVSYLAGRAQSAVATDIGGTTETDGGLFGGTSSLLGQLTFEPYDGGQFAVTYIRNEAPTGNIQSGAGSPLAQVPFGGSPFSADSIGVQGTFKLGDRFAIGGWGAYTHANDADSADDAEIFNAAINLTVFDLIKEGSQAGLIVGIPPKNFRSDFAEDPNTSVHLEGLFQFPVNNNIKITPGVIYIINPDHNEDNENVFAGVLRTTFSF